MHKYFTRIEYDTVNNNYILSSFITYLHDCNNSNKTCVTSEEGTAYHSGALEFIRGFWWVCVAQSFVFSIFVCPFVLFFWPLYCLSFFDLQLLITPLVY